MDKVELQDPFLTVLCQEQAPVILHLLNGTRLQGKIESFDQFLIMLKGPVSQVVYKRDISVVTPRRDVKVQFRRARGLAAPASGADTKTLCAVGSFGTPDFSREFVLSDKYTHPSRP